MSATAHKPGCKSQRTLGALTPGEIRAGVHGCTVGAELAMEDGNADEHEQYMERIRELVGELYRRTQTQEVVDGAL